MLDESHLRAFLAPFWSETVRDAPNEEDWRDLMWRIRQPGRTHRIYDEVYRYFLDVLPPHYHGGDFFAFCEGEEPLLLFAHRDGTFLCRQLTWNETAAFCALAGIDLPD